MGAFIGKALFVIVVSVGTVAALNRFATARKILGS